MDFERIQRIFDEATLRASEKREAYVVEACGDDAEVLTEVLALLESHDAVPADFLTDSATFCLLDDLDPDLP